MNNTPLTPQQEAADNNTSPERLRELAQINTKLARLVAQNPNTPPDVLEELASDFDFDKEIRKAVISNPNTPTLILLKLGAKYPQQLSENLITDFWLLEDAHPLLLEENKFGQKLASNPNTPIKLLAILAKNGDSDVRLKVARNPSIPVSLLEILATDADSTVRQCATANLDKR